MKSQSSVASDDGELCEAAGAVAQQVTEVTVAERYLVRVATDVCCQLFPVPELSVPIAPTRHQIPFFGRSRLAPAAPGPQRCPYQASSPAASTAAAATTSAASKAEASASAASKAEAFTAPHASQRSLHAHPHRSHPRRRSHIHLRRHGIRRHHTRHRNGQVLSFGRAEAVRHFPCRRNKMTSN